MSDQKKAKWMWFPADFELYHGMKQNFQREERGCGWPAYWKMADWRKNVRFRKTYMLDTPSSFRVKASGTGYVDVNGHKYPFGTEIRCRQGENRILINIGNMEGLPAAYVAGTAIYSDETWTADDFETQAPAGTSTLYTDEEKDPNQVYYHIEKVRPVEKKQINGGLLLDFGRLVDGSVQLDTGEKTVTICYGESEREALDVEQCYYKEEGAKGKVKTRRRAFRFLFLPGCTEDLGCFAQHQVFPLAVKSSFSSDDSCLNRIWKAAGDTLDLCSGMFFIDGAKRDRWIWSGDAYQCYFINQYYYFDPEINQRTILALRGNEEISQHINTIVDYSALWVISIYQQYMMTGDHGFLKMVYGKVKRMMEFLEGQLDEHGFLVGRKGDWIFVDWSEDMDKDGAVAAEQMLLYQCYLTMALCAGIAEGSDHGYGEKAAVLKAAIMEHFWDEERGAFIDGFSSGKRHVTRHANIFAVLFQIADRRQTEKILENVLLNPEITAIKTPYFQFYELDAMARLGYLGQVLDRIRSYWGGMLSEGAVTFWEEYTPGQSEGQKYSMYGDPYGKSLCHAWGAAPIYILGRYAAGVYPVRPGYETFVVEPSLDSFDRVDFKIPITEGSVWVDKKDGILRVLTDRSGGTLKWNGSETALVPGRVVELLC